MVGEILFNISHNTLINTSAIVTLAYYHFLYRHVSQLECKRCRDVIATLSFEIHGSEPIVRRFECRF